MTYSMIVGKYKLIFSDTHFKDFRKKPTISVYDADTNSETKIASFNSQETFEWFIEAVVEADRKTENNSEKPNNCEHITEDGVTCAKYPACDDCLDNPLNKLKGSERLVKGSEQTDLVEDSPSLVKDLVKAFGEDGTWLERQGVYTLTLAEAKQRAVDIIESVLAKDEPTISKMEQVEEPMKTTDYCDICKRDMCEICVADATNPYCVPCHYEIRYEPKTEPRTDCGDFADRLAYERGVKHAWEVAQKVFGSTVTFYEAEDVAKQIDKDINVRSKDEPKICDTCRYYNSNIPCGSTPSACKEADKFAEEFVDGLKKLKPKDEPQTNKDFKVTYTCSFTDCKNFGFNEKCIECKRKQSEARLEDEPQTDCHWK